MRPRVIWTGASSFGECPVWWAERNVICWLDIPTGTLRAYCIATSEVSTWDIGKMSAGLACQDDGVLIVGRGGALWQFDVCGARLTPFATLPDHHADERTNDLAFDASGNLWVTTMHTGGEQTLGRLLRLTRDKRWMTVLTGVPILNGPAFDHAGRVGYVCDTVRRRILRFRPPATDATTCQTPETFTTLTEAEGFPDGITVDATGHLWLAHYAGARVSCHAPDGTVRHVIPMPVRNVTSVAIGGGSLYVTSARDSSDTLRAPGGSLFVVPLARA